MKIRSKIVLVVLPLIVTPLLFTGFIAAYSARNGITAVATSFLRFKSEELENYAESQWKLLVDNDLDSKEEYVEATESAVESFALQMIRSGTELIFAIDADGKQVMATREVVMSEDEQDALAELQRNDVYGWHEIDAGGVRYTAQISRLENYEWTLFVGEQKEVFYSARDQILNRTGYILAAALAVSLSLLFVFSGVLTKPLASVVLAMKAIITSKDLSERVEILYKDETGDLGNTFNVMTGELESAYDRLETAYEQMKSYAIEAAFARHKEEVARKKEEDAREREQRIRTIFQKYVPNNVIDEVMDKPESALIGEDRVMALLFSDIRNFTTLSETLLPSDVVASLNKYFEMMVDVIEDDWEGKVDKYMGDAIMAYFGAPVKHTDDAYRALMAGFGMLDKLSDFNRWMMEQNRKPIGIGIGIHYGFTTVGNIGCEKKMDYTVIGDTVNVGSRLEGLTKQYGTPMLISDSVARKVEDQVPCRRVGKIVVKGLSRDIDVYEARKDLSPRELKGWDTYKIALEAYYEAKFSEADEALAAAKVFMPRDPLTMKFLNLCEYYIANPPPSEWTGVEVMSEK